MGASTQSYWCEVIGLITSLEINQEVHRKENGCCLSGMYIPAPIFRWKSMATQRLVLVDEILQERMPLQISQLFMMCALKLCLANACIQCTCSIDHQVPDSSRVSKPSLMVLATLGVKDDMQA